MCNRSWQRPIWIIWIVARTAEFTSGNWQIAALTVMVGALALWRHRPSFKRFSYAANLALFYGGVYLLFTQLHGYQHDAHSDSFRFPAAEHRHAHEDMDVEDTEDKSRSGI